MEYWSSPFINGDSSSNSIYPFNNFDHYSGTMMEAQQDLIHKHHVPLAMVEGEESNNINGYEKKKRKMTSEQLKLLERSFQEEMKLDPDRKMKLSKELGLQPRQIAVWFQNRKARWNTKHTKYLYQSLKQEFDVVSKEKKLLEEELIQLKWLLRESGPSKKKQTLENAYTNTIASQFQLN